MSGWREVVERVEAARRENMQLALELVEQFGLLANALELMAVSLAAIPGVPAGAARSAEAYAAGASRQAHALLDFESSIRVELRRPALTLSGSPA